ncbi:MAG TPA: KH domain-containing protein, partial [Edaphocola sp.]|nr:KH domain-containing protein [Edaphocola sp.]
EIPYHTAVVVQSFKDLPHIVRISADIVVTRETQKMIILGQKGSLIKKLGTKARESIETFLDKKVYLELFVKVRPKWRENDQHLKEYGY